ncbi:hypothetical protein CONPUDRAFT_108937 [Coniophora puteana RWD-64-598 SS2]|uniref:Uncharacterized protein n=1 Tax=Coniophora puteana (strain RWD-64-598) TaxID=741705 RepID=A0A5M3MFC4_CONPW|nr:uncharacterized protein CONPUDRAFT_108937 [Coniophora puteana RWD-64-598 SS2]EIW77696.1 hypothetical protein CONPUDRAFT_108937 [Coniophora puteana RWD-64-598 SS2]
MSAGNIDFLCELWACSLAQYGADPPFQSHEMLYKTIDSSKLGDIPWQSFSVTYQGPRPASNVPPWMEAGYDVWFRDPRKVVENMLGRPDFQNELDLTPYRDYDKKDNRRYENLFSGDWAWKQATKISKDPNTHGSTFVPVILGSDKTTVSVATGNTEYYPLYASIGNVHNGTRRARRNAVVLIGFLSIPKTNKAFSGDAKFRHFRRQLYHASLSAILQPLKDGMTMPEIVRFGDGHYRRVIYGLGPYIADYPEQVLLSGIVQGWCPKCFAFPDDLDGGDPLLRTQALTETYVRAFRPTTCWDDFGIIADVVPFTNDFPRADIHELIAPDILHQLIKGVFKDHLVDWVVEYIKAEHPAGDAADILDDIDRRIAAIAPFAGLRRFPQGRGFKQWTGDDSKALMKVYIATIEGHVPTEIVRTFRAFLEFCYTVRRDVITEDDLTQLEDALSRFHHYRTVFVDNGIGNPASLPRQHALPHYIYMIRQFGAPNGLCSSITESKHIQAVKEPWRRSSHFNALGQMLETNQRLDKLVACRVDFDARGMLEDDLASVALRDALARRAKRLLQNSFEEASSPSDHLLICEGRTRTLEDKDCAEAAGSLVRAVARVNGKELLAEVKLATTRARKRARTLPALAAELSTPNLVALTRRFLFEYLNPTDYRLKFNIPIPIAECPPAPRKIKVVNSAISTFRAPSDQCGSGGLKRERIRSTPLWRSEAPRHDCVLTIVDESRPGTLSMEVARVLGFFSFVVDKKEFECAVVHWYEYYSDERDEDTGMFIVRPMYTPSKARHLAVIHVDTMVRAAHLVPVYGKDFVSEGLSHYESYDTFDAFYLNRYIDHHAFELL